MAATPGFYVDFWTFNPEQYLIDHPLSRHPGSLIFNNWQTQLSQVCDSMRFGSLGGKQGPDTSGLLKAYVVRTLACSKPLPS